MRKIVIVTDSNCDIPDSLLKDNIKVMPLSIIMGDGEAYDIDKVSSTKFCNYLKIGINAKSIRLNPMIVHKTLESIEDDADVIIIHSSSRLIPSMELILEDYIAEYCMNHINSRVCKIDSRTTSMALGLLVLDAASMVEKEASFDDIIDYVIKNRSNYHCEFFSDNLDVLVKHKVISSRKAELAKKKNCKYLFGITSRGLIRPMKSIVSGEEGENIFNQICDDYLEEYAIISSILDNRSERIIEKVQEDLDKDIISTSISCGNLSVMGENIVGLCYKKK